ncbi:MAG: hypothetical protein SAL70_44770, partial [Scytonema sp. PMC 1070.18]|nr:hypothetical protein [Scytonema sp. PMC 1070.18]
MHYPKALVGALSRNFTPTPHTPHPIPYTCLTVRSYTWASVSYAHLTLQTTLEFSSRWLPSH